MTDPIRRGYRPFALAMAVIAVSVAAPVASASAVSIIEKLTGCSIEVTVRCEMDKKLASAAPVRHYVCPEWDPWCAGWPPPPLGREIAVVQDKNGCGCTETCWPDGRPLGAPLSKLDVA